MRTIKYYRVSQWGVVREFIHPDCAGDAAIIRQLTGQKTIDGRIRELLRDLMGGSGGLVWQEVLAPKANDNREPIAKAMEEATCA